MQSYIWRSWWVLIMQWAHLHIIILVLIAIVYLVNEERKKEKLMLKYAIDKLAILLELNENQKILEEIILLSDAAVKNNVTGQQDTSNDIIAELTVVRRVVEQVKKSRK